MSNRREIHASIPRGRTAGYFYSDGTVQEAVQEFPLFSSNSLFPPRRKKPYRGKYRMETFTPASVGELQDRPNVQSWWGLGVGVSKSYGDFEPLPAVVGELHSVIRGSAGSSEGVLPGVIMLDEYFTKESLKKALAETYPVVHIASHFAFRPGNETDSYLLLGGPDDRGEQLTLAEIRRDPNIYFRDTEVLTLSACNTATTGRRVARK